MKITYQDMKTGVIEVLPETLDDLWHLSHIIEKEDLLSAKTTRRIQDTSGEKIRSDRGIKKTFYLGIRVENVKFHMYTGKLRATGAIEKGPEDLVPLGSHHTLEVKLNIPTRIKKEKWSRWTIKRLKQSIESSKKLSALILVMEDDVADLGLIRQFGVEYYGPIMGNLPGKRIEQKDRKKQVIKFYQSIVNALEKFKDVQTIVIAGPGFTKGDFHSFLNEKHPIIAKKSILESTGTGGRVGIHEVLKKGTIEKITAENRVAWEMSSVNKILVEIAKSSSMVAYGKKQVLNAVNAGAAKELLILDKLVRQEDMEKTMDIVESMGGKVILVSSEHDGGKQLESLGGMAALLRYAIE
ncbi:mRNA surveillance protein pelota [Methanobacterium alcaliphilum]|uniref:mRNA surveillance protein pelota n=1 Tax=Methanobacterium alcaliphilum TaxID=392018 RepID=UPI00200A10A1|nr:mRNA surveillance protein pelota [Methanobacterium alcaliphilum]